MNCVDYSKEKKDDIDNTWYCSDITRFQLTYHCGACWVFSNAIKVMTGIEDIRNKALGLTGPTAKRQNNPLDVFLIIGMGRRNH